MLCAFLLANLIFTVKFKFFNVYAHFVYFIFFIVVHLWSKRNFREQCFCFGYCRNSFVHFLCLVSVINQSRKATKINIKNECSTQNMKWRKRKRWVHLHWTCKNTRNQNRHNHDEIEWQHPWTQFFPGLFLCNFIRFLHKYRYLFILKNKSQILVVFQISWYQLVFALKFYFQVPVQFYAWKDT